MHSAKGVRNRTDKRDEWKWTRMSWARPVVLKFGGKKSDLGEA
jgi:hypothetical protein